MPYRWVFCLCVLIPLLKVSAQSRRVRGERSVVFVSADGRGQYRTIQEAIDHVDTDTWIRIRPGVYRERLRLRSFVNLQGEGPAATILVAEPGGPIVEGYNIAACRLTGMTIQFEDSASEPAVLLRFGTLIVENCVIRNGSVGIDASSYSTVRLRQSWLTDHSRIGVRLNRRSEGYLSDSRIDRGGGDGIVVEDASGCNVDRLVIRDHAGAGMVFRRQSVGNLMGNILSRNAGGVRLESGSTPVVRNNTFYFNSEYAVRSEGSRQVALVNNLFVGHPVAVTVHGSEDVRLTHNGFWNNLRSVEGVDMAGNNRTAEPSFRDPERFDFRLDSSSVYVQSGEGKLNVGADFDYEKSAMRQRLDYLRNQVTKDLVRGNWYLAYQGAQEMVEIDSSSSEARSLYQQASSKLAESYAVQAREEYERGNLNLASNTLKIAEKYDSRNTDVQSLREQIDSASSTQQMYFFLIVGGLVAGTFGLGFWARKWIQLKDARRQASWWLEDAVETVESMRATDCESFDPEGFSSALQQLEQARNSFESRAFDKTEHHCAETVRFANRAKEAAERYHRLKRDAIFEVGQAETEFIRFRESGMAGRFYSEVDNIQFYLEKARQALVSKHYAEAKEIATDVQSSLQSLAQAHEQERDREVMQLIQMTEALIIDALASNTSADIISAVIDFKSDLEVIHTGYGNGQLTAQETREQVTRIKEFVEEAMKIGDPGGSVRKRTYYEILGIKEDATLEQIKGVYRKLSMIYHPDVNQDLGIAGDERFREIKEAYEALILEKSGEA